MVRHQLELIVGLGLLLMRLGSLNPAAEASERDVEAMIASGASPNFIVVDGADWCNSARGRMFAVGCVQSQLL